MKRSDPPAAPLPKRGTTYAPAQRRSEAIIAAIEVLAERGAHGLTHRKIDLKLGWPLGSTSNYFRRRIDILNAVAAQIMELDLADLAIVDADLDQPAEITSAWLVGHLTDLISYSVSAERRLRSLARAEILFECVRNLELRAIVEGQFEIVTALLLRIFAQLGAEKPAASAQFITTMMTTYYVGLTIATDLPMGPELEALVRNWVEISLQRQSKTAPSARRRRPGGERERRRTVLATERA